MYILHSFDFNPILVVTKQGELERYCVHWDQCYKGRGAVRNGVRIRIRETLAWVQKILPSFLFPLRQFSYPAHHLSSLASFWPQEFCRRGHQQSKRSHHRSNARLRAISIAFVPRSERNDLDQKMWLRPTFLVSLVHEVFSHFWEKRVSSRKMDIKFCNEVDIKEDEGELKFAKSRSK